MPGSSCDLAALTAGLLCEAPDAGVITVSVNAVRDEPVLRVHAASWTDGQRLADAFGLLERDRQLRPAEYPEDCVVEWRTWSGIALDWLVLVEVTAAADLPMRAVA